jgi:adenylate kinase
MAQDIVLLGGPGAGKGTQAKILQRHFGYDQISTGDLLRAHRANGTELGKAAEGYMQRGELVPDELIIKMVEGELPATAVLFDGFPRTAAQAEALDALLDSRGRGAALAVHFEIPRAVLEQRLLGRWTNPRTGRVYHATFNPPKASGIDDEDGGPLIQREDDRPETIGRRLDLFESETMPLVDYYAKSNRLATIDATQSVNAVTDDLRKAIGDGGRAA